MVVETAEQVVDRDGWTALHRGRSQTWCPGPISLSHVESVGTALLGELQAKALRELGFALQHSVMGESEPDGVAMRVARSASSPEATRVVTSSAIAEPIDRVGHDRRPVTQPVMSLRAVMQSFGVTNVWHTS